MTGGFGFVEQSERRDSRPRHALIVGEGIRVRFESTFTNVLNHTNFAPPATQIDVPSTFGVLSAPQTAENAGNRTGQLALRIEF